MKISEKLLRFRAEKDLSQGDVSKILGVQTRTISDWENGKFNPSLKNTTSINMMFEKYNFFVDTRKEEYEKIK